VSEASRRAIIDIGSNTVRLVVFSGSARAPLVLYNEKVSAGLGKGVVADRLLSEEAMTTACSALVRFKLLAEGMDVASLRAVATAAVRDAINGPEFVDRMRAVGIDAEVLSAEEEAQASGFGVISEFPEADGVVADLGGGSLELVRVCNGEVGELVSLPLGVFAAAQLRNQGATKLASTVQRHIAKISWIWGCDDLPLYLVGGSWRSLARFHIHQTGFGLSVLSNYQMTPADARTMPDRLAKMSRSQLAAIPSMPGGRIPMLANSASLLSALVDAIAPSVLVTCSSGLREGLLYQALDAGQRARDPLLERAKFAAGSEELVEGHGEALAAWIDPLFSGQERRLTRIMEASCHMVAAGWFRSPDFKALGGVELALHGNWIGTTPADRAMMAMALYTGLGGSGEPPELLSRLADEAALARARSWGLAMRLAQRLAGCGAASLRALPIRLTAREVILELPAHLAGLEDESLRRRLARLAAAIATLEDRPVGPRLMISAM
jgi:exopolyphosphatase / guanosine-5'-triphosphate,3'-diphosphate pyrophosphatase